MRILWDCRSISLHMGGIGQANQGWIRAFIRAMPQDWHVTALFSGICTANEIMEFVPELRTASTAFHIAEAGMIAPEFEQFRLPTILKQLRIDLYFNPCFTIPALRTTRFQCSAVHDVVFFDHPEWVDSHLQKYLIHGTDLALRCADAVFTVSEFSKARIQAIGKDRDWQADGIGIIHPSISDSLRRAAETNGGGSPPRGRFVLYLGSVEAKKGALVLLDAFAKLQSRLQNDCPQLVIAGGVGGQQFDLTTEIRKRRLDCVRPLGRIAEPQKFKLFGKAAVFVFPSLYEGFGIPPLEAMAFGVPVIAAASSSLPEVLGDAAIYVRPGDADQLANEILRLTADKDLRAELISKGSERASRYNADNEIRTLIERFRQLEMSHEHSPPCK